MRIKLKKGTPQWFKWKLSFLGEPAPINPMALFAGNMWSYFDPGSPNERYENFIRNGRHPLSTFLDSMLLYDKVIVPTHDFMSVVILISVFGEDGVAELIENNAVSFVRVKGALAYIGNGGGLASYDILHDQTRPVDQFADDDSTLEWALNGLSTKPRRVNLSRMILENTQTFPMEKMVSLIREESYKDILDSPYLRTAFSLRNTSLDHLFGVEPNQFRCGEIQTFEERDEIDSVLRIARANLEMLLALQTGCTDTATGTPVGHVLKAKQQRGSARSSPFETFGSLKEITEVPDIASYVIDASIPDRSARLHDILIKRGTRDAVQFRAWFHEKCRDSPHVIAKEYGRLMHDIPFVSTHKGKTLRLLATTMAGVYDPALGLVTSIADSFLVDLVRKRNPKYFIEDLRQINN